MLQFALRLADRFSFLEFLGQPSPPGGQLNTFRTKDNVPGISLTHISQFNSPVFIPWLVLRAPPPNIVLASASPNWNSHALFVKQIIIQIGFLVHMSTSSLTLANRT